MLCVRCYFSFSFDFPIFYTRLPSLFTYSFWRLVHPVYMPYVVHSARTKYRLWFVATSTSLASESARTPSSEDAILEYYSLDLLGMPVASRSLPFVRAYDTTPRSSYTWHHQHQISLHAHEDHVGSSTSCLSVIPVTTDQVGPFSVGDLAAVYINLAHQRPW
jgi:hypothetical protein